nr:hypothetical protein [Tanacetum cinerariifolium]
MLRAVSNLESIDIILLSHIATIETSANFDLALEPASAGDLISGFKKRDARRCNKGQKAEARGAEAKARITPKYMMRKKAPMHALADVCLMRAPHHASRNRKKGIDTAYLLLYVDDIVLIAYSETLLRQIIASLHKEFSMTNLGHLNYFLGISISRDSSGKFLSLKKYVVEILERAHIVNCNPSRTPIDTESKLGSDGVWFLIPLYIGVLQPHFSALKRILRYIQGTMDYGLQLFSTSTTDLVAYSDADWAGCPTTRRSTSGYCVFLGNNLLSWSSKRQPTLSRSSSEAEYRGVANVVAETCWLRNLLCELHTPLSSARLVYCDNVSVVYLSCNSVQHQRTKHTEINTFCS